MFLTMMLGQALAADEMAWPNDCRVDIELTEDGRRKVSHDNCDNADAIAAWADALKLPEGETGTAPYLLAKDHFVAHDAKSENMAGREILKQSAPATPKEAKKHGFQSEAVVLLTVAPNGKVSAVEAVRCASPYAEGLDEAFSGWQFAKADAESKFVVSVDFKL